MADNHIIQPHNLVVRPLTTVEFRARKEVKLNNIKKKGKK